MRQLHAFAKNASNVSRVVLVAPSENDSQTIPPGLVRKILVKDVGLTAEEAAAILGL